MKKIGFILTLLLFMGFVSQAQLAANRTSETKVADLLAMQPAENRANLSRAMQEMEGFSKKDFSLLLQGLSPQGGENARIKYAANSYAFHVMQPGKETHRQLFVGGLLDALERVEDDNKKGFILRLLIQSGRDEAVAAITPYLQDENLSGKAARVLNRIGTEKAITALSAGLDQSETSTTAIGIISALGDLKVDQAEGKIIAQLDQYEHPELNRTVYFALSEIGGPLAQKLFEKKLKEIDYQYEREGVAGAAIRYASHLKDNGATKKATKFVKKIYKNAKKSNRYQAQVAALGLLEKWQPQKARKELLKATSSDYAALRELALEGLGSSQKAMDRVIKSLPKASAEKQQSVLLFLAKREIPASLDLIKPFIESDNLKVRLAAFEAIHRLSKQKDIQLLVDHLGSGETKQDQLLKQLILSANNEDAIAIVNKSLVSATDVQKEILLDILSARRNTGSFDAVFPLTKSNNPTVRKKAFQALPNVSSIANLDKLLANMASLSGAELQATQQAVVAALQYSSSKDNKIADLATRTTNASGTSAAKFFPVFAGLGGQKALQVVDGYTQSANTSLKSSAIQALANWKNADALPLLLEHFREKQNDKDFDILFKGLIAKVKESNETPERKSLYLRDAFEYARTIDQKRMALAAMQETETYQSFRFASRFLDDKDLKSVATNTALNIATGPQYLYGSEVRKILKKVSDNLTKGGNESSYLNEAVVRHLNEMPDKEGFVSIFNGKNLSGWKGLVENPVARRKMSAAELEAKQKEADQLMRSGWKVVDGELVFTGKGSNIATTKDYGDFVMLVDWKLDKNGKEPDAGVYLRGTPQVQIWDISRTNVGAQVGSGGLYNNAKYETDPLKVADNPLGEWNTFKIKMVGDKVSVWLNGELVTDQVVLENYWDRSQPIFPKEQIELQAHGSKVYYRDIYIKELPGKEKFTLSPEEKKAGFEILFDGSDLDKWEGSNGYTINEAGELWVNPEVESGNSGRNFFTKKEYSDFVYRFEFKLTEGANNGVGIRVPLNGDGAYEGMEIQILDDDADIYKNLEEYQYHGSVYGVIPAKRGSLKQVGEWNKEEIRIRGNKIKVTVNGQVIIDGDIREASKNGTLDGKDHPGLQRTKGHIGFLGHGDVVYFRNIRVREL